MTVQTLLLFLIGDRQAIEQLAADPWTVWVGIVFLCSTGLARTYDSRDLMRQPWFLLLPFGATLVVTWPLYGLLCSALVPTGPPPFPAGYWSLLGLFLMTAPLAWLYAIPLQRFLDARQTVRARLIVLAVVAGWRVALLSRALSVLLDDRLAGSFFLVMLVGDLLVLVALFVLSQQHRESVATPALLGIMGGISISTSGAKEREFMSNVTGIVFGLGLVSVPGWMFGLHKCPLSAANWLRILGEARPGSPPSMGVSLLAGGAVLFFLCLLAWRQPAQRLRTRIDSLLRQGAMEPALREMANHSLRDFPPHWSPPPADHYRDPPTLLGVLEIVLPGSYPAWLRAAYRERLREYLGEPLWYWYYDEELERITALLGRLPEGPELARHIQSAVEKWEREVRTKFAIMAKGEEEPAKEEDPLALFKHHMTWLHPEPQLTGRRTEIIAALWRLAEADPST
jgi:hypothetical protein